MLHGVRPPSRDDDERRARYRCQAVMINALQRPAADYLERDMVGATHKTHVARAHTHGRRRRMRCCKGQCAQTSRIGLEMHAVREMVRVAPHEREGLCHNLWASRLRLGGSHTTDSRLVSHVPRDRIQQSYTIGIEVWCKLVCPCAQDQRLQPASRVTPTTHTVL